MSIEKIKVPDIGGVEDVEVIEICVAVGDTVAIDDSIVVLESEKASMEVPSPVSGRITAISIQEGDQLSEGDLIVEIDTATASAGNSTDGNVGDEDSNAQNNVDENFEVTSASDTIKESQHRLRKKYKKVDKFPAITTPIS